MYFCANVTTSVLLVICRQEQADNVLQGPQSSWPLHEETIFGMGRDVINSFDARTDAENMRAFPPPQCLSQKRDVSLHSLSGLRGNAGLHKQCPVQISF